MNYRHAFHAGNFADLVKHAALTLLLEAMTADPAPLSVIDTHAGAGLYDLGDDMAKKSGEAAVGIARLIAAPDAPRAFDALKAAVAEANPEGGLRLYPGSPALIGRALRKADRYIACEIRDDDVALLRQTLAPYPGAQAVQADGFATAVERMPAIGRVLVLIDPPFERADDYANIAATMAAVRARNPAAAVAAWLPLKDLETFDAFLRSLEPAGAGALVAEARLKPLTDPMKMNGCAMVIAGAPASLEAPLQAACDWVVARLGSQGGKARLWRLA
ncbi:MAG: rRNA ((2030)-N(6))-methyltransferase RlmJ [Caulobacter sp.]|nr:rRNA ((2030)-N(6))-methyltransferase RlmJ [Caulobacter sp.]